MTAPKIVNDRYALVGKPADGRFAEIFKATDLQNDAKIVAIKLFRKGMPDDAVIREAFERESQRLIDLRNENIVSMLDYGIDSASGRPFLAMEWAGEPVVNWWKENRPGKVSWEIFYQEVGKPLLSALAFAHSRETVHRELKPSDILRDQDGKIRLTDFGVAKFPEFFDSELDIESFLKGKEPFSPINGYDADYSYATDIFSYGAIALYFMDGLKIHTWNELYKSLQLSTITRDIRVILEECLAKEAAERPINVTGLGKLDHMRVSL